MPQIDASLLEQLLTDILIRHNTSVSNARCVAQALVRADIDGLHSHGAARTFAYAKQARNGKVDGNATPTITHPTSGVICVDAAGGFAYPAIELGLEAATRAVKTTGITMLSVGQSHHSGAIGQFIEPLAIDGLLVMAFSNATAAIAPAGGIKALFGTNPIAFAAPRKDAPPLLLDLSLSKVARGKIKLAADAGRPIPEGWAIDTQGHPTTDSSAALDGALLPIGEAKGAALALMLELLCAGLSGSNYGFQAGSFFTEDGVQPRIGQLFIIIDPQHFQPRFAEHAEVLFREILAQPGTRLPGSQRFANRERALCEGIDLDEALLRQLETLANS